jgi:hypothetical protein
MGAYNSKEIIDDAIAIVIKCRELEAQRVIDENRREIAVRARVIDDIRELTTPVKSWIKRRTLPMKILVYVAIGIFIIPVFILGCVVVAVSAIIDGFCGYRC